METKKILIIDDDDDLRKAIQDLLGKQKYRVIAAGNGKTGLELLNKYDDIRVVIIDLKMRDLSGVDILKAIKNYMFPLQRIVLTAYEDELSSKEAEELKVFTYLNKPVEKQSLLFTINKAFKDLEDKEI